MRKAVITLLSLGALAAGAQAAHADVRSTTYAWSSATQRGTRCITPNQYGVYGQYGAWGDFIDGCTAVVQCPAAWARCTVQGTGTIYVRDRYGNKVTANARLRWGAYHLDASCAGRDWCYAAPWAANVSTDIAGGQYASLQCNGVRDEMIPDSQETLAKMDCEVWADRRA